jgi:hypothetical protein
MLSLGDHGKDHGLTGAIRLTVSPFSALPRVVKCVLGVESKRKVAGQRDAWISSVALAGGAGVDALAYRRERQRARPRRLRRSSAAVRLRLARCLRVRNLVRRTLRFGPYSGPRARGPSTSMRRSRSVVAHIGCAGFFGARCAGRAVAIVVLNLGIERWQ